ncbi:MAG TPA: transglycosylase family protein [Solirubrobacterales bacterium]|nr:transglycosylase family protein [Solirubrobacterales bacterium]
MPSRRSISTIAVTLGALFPAAAIAAAVDAPLPGSGEGRADVVAGDVLERPAQRLHQAIQLQVREMRRQALERAARAEARRQAEFAGLGVSTSTLEAIAACESGGDPAAVSSDGTYRGKYQFDYGTWASVGGSGDPAAAPEGEQDYRAALLYSQSASSPWPNCGV